MESVASASDLSPTLDSRYTKQLSKEELRQEADGLYAGIAYLNQTEQIEDDVVEIDDDDEDEEEEIAECSMVPEVRSSSAVASCPADFEAASARRRNQDSHFLVSKRV
jgi:hypothetical protein